MKRKNMITWINRTVGICAVTVTLLCVGFFFWIHSRSGMDWLADTIRNVTGNEVHLTGLSGRIPYHVEADRLELRDDDGVVWLTASNLAARISVPMIWKREIIIPSGSAGDVAMLEVPAYRRTTTKAGPRRALIKSIRIEEGTVARFTMSTNVTVIGFSGPVKGRFVWQPGGVMAAEATAPLVLNGDTPLDVTASMQLNDRRIRFDNVMASGAGVRLDGEGRIDLTNRSYEFVGIFSVAELSRLSTIIGQPVRGPLSGRATLSKHEQDGTWKLAFDVHSDRLFYRDWFADQLTSTGLLSLGKGSFAYEADVRAETAEMREWILRKNHLQVRGTGREHTIVAMVAGWQTASTSTVCDAKMELGISGGTLNTINLSATNIDLTAWSRVLFTNLPHLSGNATISLGWTNQHDHMSGHARLYAGQVTFAAGLLENFDQSELLFTAELENDRLRLLGEATHPLLDHFSTEAEIPVIRTNSFMPLAARVEQIQTHVKMSGNLKKIGDSLLAGPTDIGGHISVDMRASQLFGEPQFDGLIVLTNGQYRKIQSGTFLDRIDLKLTGNGNRLVFSRASATDGNTGSMSATGVIVMAEGWKPEIAVHGTLTNATLFRLIRTDLPLSGRIDAVTSNQTVSIYGNLWLEPFRFVIPRRLPPSIPVLEVKEINHPDQSGIKMTRREDALPAAVTETDSRILLNIDVKTRNVFIVSGRGLSSEWRGEMNLRGNMTHPRLIGRIESVNGYAMLLGRRFNIDDGIIQLTGAVPPNPTILASASTRIGDTVARLVANGTIQNPRVTLTSEPLLSDDEIMALILFGKSVETMSPWQAIALANGLRILSGSGDLVDVIDNSQSLIQVDQIDIKQDEEGEGFSSISVGKYIGRRLYVEGEKGFGEAADSVTVTLELSPRLILETEASPRIREGIGLYWRREF